MKRIISVVIAAMFCSQSLLLAAGIKPTRSTRLESDFKLTASRGQLAEPRIDYGHFTYNAIGNTVSVVYESSVVEEIPEELRRFITKFLGSETIRSCTEYKAVQDGDMVTLFPKKTAMKKHFVQAEVYFNPLTGFVREIVAMTEKGDVITIEVFNIEAR